MKVLIVYDSRTGNTEEMAYAVSKGIEENGLEPILKKVDKASVDEVISGQVLRLGSSVYYGLPTGKIKEFITPILRIPK